MTINLTRARSAVKAFGYHRCESAVHLAEKGFSLVEIGNTMGLTAADAERAVYAGTQMRAGLVMFSLRKSALKYQVVLLRWDDTSRVPHTEELFAMFTDRQLATEFAHTLYNATPLDVRTTAKRVCVIDAGSEDVLVSVG